MAFLLRHLVRMAAQKIASDPQMREKAAKAARVVAKEASQIAREEDRALAAGRAVRRVFDRFQGDR
jgi:hypothetical protein